MLGWIEHFHFLRPLWLFALPAGLLLCQRWWQQRHTSSGWHRVIEPRLLQHLLREEPGGNRLIPPLLMHLAVVLAVLALAGPTWQKLPQAVQKRQDALVILLDLSLSMYAEDIKPSRLERAKYKLHDLLEKRQEGLTALVVFSGDAHVVSPLTDDTNTIAALVPALSPAIMPLYGSDALAAVDAATKLIRQANLNGGHIVAITDEISAAQSEAIAKHLAGSDFRLSILAVGTAEGAPIRLPNGGFLKDNSGTIVIPRLDSGQLQDLATKTNGRFSTLQLSERDIVTMLERWSVPGMQDSLQSVERDFDQWREEGPWLVVLLVPLAALGFRRGWLLAWLPLALCLASPSGYALEWQDLWLNQNQQAARKLADQQPQEAAELFTSPEWRGVANYQAGNYQQAAEEFASGQRADDHYNRGNALAKAGQLQQAVTEYEEALKLNPNHEDARANQQLVNELLEQQQSQPQQSEQDSQKDEQQSDQQSDQSSQQQSQQQQNSTQPNSEQKDSGQQQPEHSNPNQAEEKQNADQDSEQSQAEHSDQNSEQQLDQDSTQNKAQAQNQDTRKPQQKPLQQTEVGQKQQDSKQDQSPQQAAATDETITEQAMSPEQQQELNQWLRHIPDDPGGLLKRKFEYEYQLNQYQGRKNEEQPW